MTCEATSKHPIIAKTKPDQEITNWPPLGVAAIKTRIVLHTPLLELEEE